MAGETLVLFLHSGAHFEELAKELTAVFTGQEKHAAVTVHSPLRSIQPFQESWLKRIFSPTTVAQYLGHHAKADNLLVTAIDALDYIKPTAKVRSLDWGARRLLALHSTLAQGNKVVLDLMGHDPTGAERMYAAVKTAVGTTGAAIVLDNAPDLQAVASKFIVAKVAADS